MTPVALMAALPGIAQQSMGPPVEILLVDDTHLNLKLLKYQIEAIFRNRKKALSISLVDNALDAEKALSQKSFIALTPKVRDSIEHPPSTYVVAFLDNFIPGNPGSPQADRGIKIAKMIRELEILKELRHVVLIAYSADVDQDKFSTLLFDAVIKKPSSLEEIEAALESQHLFE